MYFKIFLLFFLLTGTFAADDLSCGSCKKIYSPVCCRRSNGEMTTEANACQCVKCFESSFVLFSGACEKPRPCSCQCYHSPVCCQFRDGTVQTAPNPCQCTQCDKGTIVSKGVCSEIEPDINPILPSSEEAVAPEVVPEVEEEDEDPEEEVEEEDLVEENEEEEENIGVVEGDQPQSNNITPKEQVIPAEAEAPKCMCSFEFKPVCCKQPNGSLKTACNACICTKLEKGQVNSDGLCDGAYSLHSGATKHPKPTTAPEPTAAPATSGSNCPSIYDPVCCFTKTGKFVTMGNTCECKSQRGKVKKDSVCSGKEVCPKCAKNRKRICCMLKGGKKFTQMNACMCTSCHPDNAIVKRSKC